MRALVDTIMIGDDALRLRTLAPAGRRRDVLGRTMVLLPGAGLSHRAFRRLHAALSRRHRTIAIDLPGSFGRGSSVASSGTVALASGVLAALDDLGVAECVIVAHGSAGQIAAESAAARPELVSSIVLLAPTADDRVRSPLTRMIRRIADVPAEGIRMNVRLLVDIARSGGSAVRRARAARRYPLFAVIARLRVPVLVLRGHDDPVSTHPWARRLAGVAERGVLVELPGPHHVHERHPWTVAAIVDEFLRVQALERLGE